MVCFDDVSIKINGIGSRVFFFLPFKTSISTTQVSLNFVVVVRNPSQCVVSAKFIRSP